MAYRYTVQATFTHKTVAQEWIDWLESGHCQQVLDGGATRVEVLKLDGDEHSFEVRYDFPDGHAFAVYERDHAPRLRKEGLELFPIDRGVRYSRHTGVVVFGPTQ